MKYSRHKKIHREVGRAKDLSGPLYIERPKSDVGCSLANQMLFNA